ncbi:MAG: VOC family protein [Solirubrobacteraceae bacterium]
MGDVYSLPGAAVHTALPAADLERAKTFFREKLGLTPTSETEGTALYQVRDGQLALFVTSGKASGDHTQIGWTVEDIEATVAELRERGVPFDEYDDPGFKTVNGIVSFGSTHFAWFRDSEGNVHNLAQYG